MRRREAIELLGGMAVLWPSAIVAQQSAPPVIAVLAGGQFFPSFTDGVVKAGYVPDRNVRIEFHSVKGRYDQLPQMAQELVSRRVAVIVPWGVDAAQAVKAATASIPIVFVVGVDPIKLGFVQSLNHPGGNITGMSLYTSELHEKRVDMLHEIVPPASSIGMIVNPKMPDTEAQVKSAEAAARAKGHALVVVKASSESELEAAFLSLSEAHVAGILAVSDNFLNSRRDQSISLAERYSIPMMHPFRGDAAAGGLLSYGTNIDEQYRQAGVYAVRILKGEKPGDLPVQQPTRFDLVLNLKTAKALNLTIPTAILVRADEIIE